MHVLPAGLERQGHQDAFYTSPRGVKSKLGATVIDQIKLHISVERKRERQVKRPYCTDYRLTDRLAGGREGGKAVALYGKKTKTESCDRM